METVLFLAHTESDGSLGKPALEALGAARDIAAACGAASLVAAVVGNEAAKAAGKVAACGANRFLCVSGGDYHQPRYGTDAAAAEAVCRASGATMVVAPATSRWCRALPGVAQRLGGRVDSRVTGIKTDGGEVSVSRWYYRQRMEGTLTRSSRPWVIMVDPGSREPWRGEPGDAKVEEVNVTLGEDARRTSVTGIVAPPADEQTIRPDARLLFVAGAGWTKKQADGRPHGEEAAGLILGFLRASKASLGGSKSLVDISGEGQSVLPFMTHLNQVGQTGATPRHPKGLATCCHGEEPHVVGWRFITERRAVNLDPNCGWAQGKADVLYVADAFAVMAKVNSMLGGSG